MIYTIKLINHWSYKYFWNVLKKNLHHLWGLNREKDRFRESYPHESKGFVLTIITPTYREEFSRRAPFNVCLPLSLISFILSWFDPPPSLHLCYFQYYIEPIFNSILCCFCRIIFVLCVSLLFRGFISDHGRSQKTTSKYSLVRNCLCGN